MQKSKKSDVIFFHGGPLTEWVRAESKRLGQTIAEFMRRLVEAAKKGGAK
ncbi:MAG TPA: hypothetical protein VJ801_18535 [Polyangia bacterium]|jgi:hypothetical protein|nr:hypothetical protein [Polyangia bacterium]